MTPASDLKARLDAAVKRRDELAQKRQRLLGRLEEAERAVEELRTKCRAKGIDPDNLDGVIAKLEAALEQSVTNLEAKLTEAERALEPFTTTNRK
jgi:SOS response regulatory protein OraA/RecX